MPEVINRYRW
jgi:hypothetical protein